MRTNQIFVVMYIAAAAPSLLATAAVAQSRANPADSTVQVPPALYRSPFAGYRALAEEPVGNWRAANDEVGRIGGWREYAREAQEPGLKPGAAPSERAPEPAPTTPAPTGHGSHGQPGVKQ